MNLSKAGRLGTDNIKTATGDKIGDYLASHPPFNFILKGIQQNLWPSDEGKKLALDAVLRSAADSPSPNIGLGGEGYFQGELHVGKKTNATLLKLYAF